MPHDQPRSNGPPTADYPTRPKFFANDYVRLMADACLANEIGAAACFLLVVIVMTEDRTRYTKSVTFFNAQLTRMMGYSDEDAMSDVRKKAVESGWLAYKPGRKGVPGLYHVLVPPEYADAFPGDTTAERRSKVGGEQRDNGGESQGKVPTIHTHPFPVPDPTPHPGIPPAAPAPGESGPKTKKTRTKTAAETAAETDPRFVRFWTTYPKKVDKPDVAAEFARLDPSPEVLEQIIAAVERQKRSEGWTKEGGQYITHPKKWLRNRKWDDEIDMPNPKPAQPKLSLAEAKRRAAGEPTEQEDIPCK